MVVKRTEKRAWKMADDWEHNMEDVKLSPSQISEGYPTDRLEGITIQADQSPVITSSESLTLTHVESNSIIERVDEETRHVATRNVILQEETRDDEEVGPLIETTDLMSILHKPFMEATEMILSLNIGGNIQKFADAAKDQTHSASVFVSTFVGDGIHSGVTSMVKQLEIIESAIMKQMHGEATQTSTPQNPAPTPSPPKGTIPFERKPLESSPPSGEESPKDSSPPKQPGISIPANSSSVSTMGDTFAEFVKPLLYETSGASSHRRRVIDFNEESLKNAAKATPEELAQINAPKATGPNSKTPIVIQEEVTIRKRPVKESTTKVIQVCKARGRARKRIVTPRSKSAVREVTGQSAERATREAKLNHGKEFKSSGVRFGGKQDQAATGSFVLEGSNNSSSKTRAKETTGESAKPKTTLKKVAVAPRYSLFGSRTKTKTVTSRRR